MFETNACEYQLANDRNHPSHQPQLADFKDHYQIPGHQELNCDSHIQCKSRSQEKVAAVDSHYQTGYTYPTLNFLLPGTDLNLLQTTNTSSILSEDYGRQPTSGKQKKTEYLHPFYKRQLLTMKQSRDGLTRTRDTYRVVYTEKQKQLLEDEYEKNNFITENRRSFLVKETNLSERQIKFWFQNRRAKDKRNTKLTKGIKKTQKPSPSYDAKSQTIHSPDTVRQVTKEPEFFACKYTFKTPIAKPTNSPNFKIEEKKEETIQNENQSELYAGSCMFSDSPIENQSVSPITGSCRLEHLPSCFNSISPSPTGHLFQCRYAISQSDWTLTKQHSYMLDRVDMSPLFNGLQTRFDDRL